MMLRRPKPLEDDLAVIHSPTGVAARLKRCKEIREGLDVDALNRIVYRAGIIEENKALDAAMHRDMWHPTEKEKREANAAACRNLDALILRQLEVSELAREAQAAYNHPDRMEYARISTAWAHQVDSIAFTHGNKVEAFVGRVRDLLRQRDDAEAIDDEDEVRRIEGRLDKLTGVPFPVLPDAAWIAADTLPEADRQPEYDRLTEKYGVRNAATNGNGAVTKTRTIRKPRTLVAAR